MSAGYVYVLSNPSMPGVVKIGRSIHGGASRGRTFYTTGVPTPYVLEFEIYSDDHGWLEFETHRSMAYCRANPDREFFRCSPPCAIETILGLYTEHLSGGDYRVINGLMYEGTVDLLALAHKLDLAPFDVFGSVSFLTEFAIKKAIEDMRECFARVAPESKANG